MSTPDRYCSNCRQMVRPRSRVTFATGWLVVLAGLLASVPLALVYDQVAPAVIWSLAGACSLIIVVWAVRTSARLHCQCGELPAAPLQ